MDTMYTQKQLLISNFILKKVMQFILGQKSACQFNSSFTHTAKNVYFNGIMKNELESRALEQRLNSFYEKKY